MAVSHHKVYLYNALTATIILTAIYMYVFDKSTLVHQLKPIYVRLRESTYRRGPLSDVNIREHQSNDETDDNQNENLNQQSKQQLDGHTSKKQPSNIQQKEEKEPGYHDSSDDKRANPKPANESFAYNITWWPWLSRDVDRKSGDGDRKWCETVNKTVRQPQYACTGIHRVLLQPRSGCHDAASYDVIVIVHSALDHQPRRQTFREVYGDVINTRPYRFKVVFLLGRPEDDILQEQLEAEAEVHDDIVQGNFVDSYRNLTHKAIVGYQWLDENCEGSKLVMKLDDDVFVNMVKFLDLWKANFSMSTNTIFCDGYKWGYAFR